MNDPKFSEGTAVILMDKDISNIFGKLKNPFTGKAGNYALDAFKTMIAE